ncbi:hypothetical protein DPMN_074995 [Dreissena polymorpha]|uniref:Uncharacterized protein n=1 Tax=Dreissena polymorpha TaxID=45954 RepID=A0A9D3YIR1_DREPO|nr:hypothetical protein DPMN_074995 [Dreissena polymorpha]
MESCSYFTDTGSDIGIRSSLVVQNSAEICEAVHIPLRLSLDCDGCVVGCVDLEHLALPSC